MVLAPVDGGHYLLFGAAVIVEHQAGGVFPPFPDIRALAAVGLDAGGEVLAEAVHVRSRRFR